MQARGSPAQSPDPGRRYVPSGGYSSGSRPPWPYGDPGPSAQSDEPIESQNIDMTLHPENVTPNGAQEYNHPAREMEEPPVWATPSWGQGSPGQGTHPCANGRRAVLKTSSRFLPGGWRRVCDIPPAWRVSFSSIRPKHRALRVESL